MESGALTASPSSAVLRKSLHAGEIRHVGAGTGSVSGGPLAEFQERRLRWTLPVRNLLLLVSGALDLYPPKAGAWKHAVAWLCEI